MAGVHYLTMAAGGSMGVGIPNSIGRREGVKTKAILKMTVTIVCSS